MANGDFKGCSAMKVKDELRQQREKMIQMVGSFAAAHPELTFEQIGNRLGVHPMWASRAARAIGQPARKRGRKKVQRQTVEVG
ncbi:MAG: hypothetical protein ACM3JB_27035 [Acidobacteriaceae bacterium]